MTTDRFTFDAFARKHLAQWFDAGLCPNDWDRNTLEAFSAWCEINAEDFSEYADWATIARYFEQQTEPLEG